MKKIISVTLFVILFISNFSFAHVSMSSSAAEPGAFTKLTFRIPHGCDGSPTTKITVQLPEGTTSVKPQVHYGWKIKTKKIKLEKPIAQENHEITETISEVTWTGGPLEDQYMDEFGISLRLPETSAKFLSFPVIQECKKGTLKWIEVPKEADEAKTLKRPTPILEMQPKKTIPTEHHH